MNEREVRVREGMTGEQKVHCVIVVCICIAFVSFLLSFALITRQSQHGPHLLHRTVTTTDVWSK